jgi:chorismate synthase
MNSFGTDFRITIYGESHGIAVGIIIDGVPAGISLKPDDFLSDINMRKPGAKGTTSRMEEDVPKLISGVFNERTTGAPLHIQFDNKDVRSGDYEQIKNHPRPGHADFVAFKKFKGFNDYRGGGHFSGRLTLPLVAAGVIAKKIIDPILVNAKVIEVGGRQDIETAVQEALNEKDSIGGVVGCSIVNVPIGLGEPFFNSLESMISHLIFSIPSVKGIEFGSGFAASKMKGSEHNDRILDASGKTSSNFAGGINGGISNGNEIYFRVAIKPTSSIQKEQESFNLISNKLDLIEAKGRHDACIALRVPVVVEAVAAIVMADFYLQQAAEQ